MKDQRIGCCIPGCRRTTSKPVGEWICGKHWQAIEPSRRRVWHRHRRQERLVGYPLRPAAYDRIWSALKAAIIDL